MMSVDLSGLRVGTAWRVRTNYTSGVLFVRGTEAMKLFVVQYDDDNWDRLKESGIGVGAVHHIKQILHELKPVSDITAADLDSLIITTKDGTRVLFADDTARLQDRSGRIHGGKACNDWQIGGNVERERDAYLEELESRKNPPVEIVWQGECRDDDGTLLSAWCEVRGEKWRMSRTGIDSYMVYLGKQRRFVAIDQIGAEDRIRDHYKDRAAESA